MTPTLFPFEPTIAPESGPKAPKQIETLKEDSKAGKTSDAGGDSEAAPSEDFLATLLAMMGGDNTEGASCPGAEQLPAEVDSSVDGGPFSVVVDDGEPVDDAQLLAALAALVTDQGAAVPSDNAVVQEAPPKNPGQLEALPPVGIAALPVDPGETAAQATLGEGKYGKPAPGLSPAVNDNPNGDTVKAATGQGSQAQGVVAVVSDPVEAPPAADPPPMPKPAAGLSGESEPDAGKTGVSADGRPGVSADVEKPALAGEKIAGIVPEPAGAESENRFEENGAGRRQARQSDSGGQDRPYFLEEDTGVDGEPGVFSLAAGEENEDGMGADELPHWSRAGLHRGGQANPAHATVKGEPADGLDVARTPTGHQPGVEKAASGTEAVRAATAPRSVQSHTINQIVDRAIFIQRNGQPEVRIDLKPEHLGRIQMKISTENQRVTVHMLAETPMAREIIEANLGQLRADLAGQGLEVDHFDVDMFASNDSERQDADTLNQGRGRTGGAMTGALTGVNAETQPTREGPAPRTSDRSVDYFA